MPQPTTLREIALAMFAVDRRHERTVLQWERELWTIFSGAEELLYQQRADLLTRLLLDGDKLKGGPEALVRINELAGQVRAAMHTNLVEPAKLWADQAIPGSWSDGRALARANASHVLVDRDAVREAFRHVLDAEAGILQTGLRDTYEFLGTVGDDVGTWFRREMTQAALLGMPVQGPGSLEERLFESGRLKAQVIRTKDGRLVHRSLRQRAIATARVETAKVYNRVHEVKTEEVFGGEAVYANANPEDSRTTRICQKASGMEPMTLAEWDKSDVGRPPRLDQEFHLCRSFLAGGTRAMFRGEDALAAVESAREEVG